VKYFNPQVKLLYTCIIKKINKYNNKMNLGLILNKLYFAFLLRKIAKNLAEVWVKYEHFTVINKYRRESNLTRLDPNCGKAILRDLKCLKS